MNNQQFFNKSVRHLREQGRKAWGKTANGQRSCAYRTTAPDGEVLMCAVGGTMPKKLINILEKSGQVTYQFEYLYNSMPEVKHAFQHVSKTLVMDVQAVHDDMPPSRWERGFKRVAKIHGLELPK